MSSFEERKQKLEKTVHCGHWNDDDLINCIVSRDEQIERYEKVLKTMFELFDYKNFSPEINIDKELFKEVEEEIK